MKYKGQISFITLHVEYMIEGIEAFWNGKNELHEYGSFDHFTLTMNSNTQPLAFKIK